MTLHRRILAMAALFPVHLIGGRRLFPSFLRLTRFQALPLHFPFFKGLLCKECPHFHFVLFLTLFFSFPGLAARFATEGKFASKANFGFLPDF